VVPEPEPSQTQSPEPEPLSPSEPTPSPEESPVPDPAPEATDLPSNNDIIDAAVEDAVSDGNISESDTQEIIGDLLSDGEISQEEVTNLSDSLTEDGVLTEDEKELLVDVILEQADGSAISTELINELGLDYEDLPDDQPVALENGVILFAEVADALEMFENPSEILGAVFTDPGKALTAIANVGADMTPEKREESQKVIVASVIAAQVLTASSVIGRIR
jgi:polyhydroxyalkanoate synthesis regulator phasin